MKLHKSKLPQVLHQWVSEQVLPKTNDIGKLSISFLWNQHKKNIDAMADKYGSMFGADESGYFDVDTAHESALKSLESCGGKVLIPVLNWNFDKTDVEDIFKIIRSQAE